MSYSQTFQVGWSSSARFGSKGPRIAKSTVLPSAAEVLRAGDVLALAGPAEAVEAARQLLASGVEQRQSP